LSNANSIHRDTTLLSDDKQSLYDQKTSHPTQKQFNAKKVELQELSDEEKVVALNQIYNARNQSKPIDRANMELKKLFMQVA